MKTFLFIIFLSLLFICSCIQNNENKAAAGVNENSASTKNADTALIAGYQPDDSTGNSRVNEARKRNKENNQKYFTIISSASEDWVAGMAGGGRGTEYFFKIKITSDEKLLFDSAWINNKAFAVYISKERKSVTNQPVSYANGDTITLRVSDIRSTKKRNTVTANVDPPLKYEGAALISFYVNGNRNYYIINEIIKRKSVNRP